MADVLKNAMNYRNRLKAELAKVEDFLRMAEQFSKDSGELSLVRIPVLAFAVGVYLPLSTMTPVFLGGLLRWVLTRRATAAVSDGRTERGVLLASGFVGGEGLLGVALAGIAFALGRRPEGIGHAWAGEFGAWLLGAVSFTLLAGWFFRRVRAAGPPGQE